MESVRSQNQAIKEAVVSGKLEELSYLKNDETLGATIALLKAQLTPAFSQQTSQILIETEETRCLNTLAQGGLFWGHGDDQSASVSKDKWVECGLNLLKIHNFIQEKGADYQLTYPLFLKSAILMLLGSRFDVMKAQLLYDLKNASEQYQEKCIVSELLQAMDGLRLIEQLSFSQLLLFIQSSVKGSFLSVLPETFIEQSLFRSILEYNIFAVSSVYCTISFDNLVDNCLKMTGLVSDDLLMSTVSQMIESGRLCAKIDQVGKTILFEEPEPQSVNQKIHQWRQWYLDNFLRSLNSATEAVLGVTE